MSAIFISHSSRDNDAAIEIGAWLGARGHRSVFLDFDPANGIPAGRNWEQELYRNIRTCRAVIALCSEHWLASRWCFMELTHARALGKQIFPLRLDDCRLDGLISESQIVDFRTNKPEAYTRLWNGLIAGGLDPAEAFDWDGSRSAYPGLLAFQEEDAAVFFGRDDEIGEGFDLLQKCHRLGDTRLVMVLGASGSGKSSLVRAGLMPRLRRDTRRWLVVDPFRPREDPAGELAAALSRAYTRAGQPQDEETLRATLSRGSPDALGSLITALRRTSANPDVSVLVTIDQFEELLGHAPDHTATRFLQMLRQCLVSGGSLIVLATMRSDFLGYFQQSPALLDVRYENLSLGPMAPGDVAQVIERPAALQSIELGPGLVQALIDDARAQDALPLLAFTLRELAERYGADHRIELEEYRSGLGGMQAAVAKSAEELIAGERLTPGQEDDFRRALLSLVRITDDGAYARRVARWSDLPAAIHPVLEKLVTARLLVSRDEGTGTVLEVAHEALFKSWTRLVGWLKDSAAALRLREQIGVAARTWSDANRPDEELWRGGRLVRARELAGSGDLHLEALEQSFVDASVRAEDAEIAAAHRRRRRRLQGLVAVAVGGLLLSAYAFDSARKARRARADADLAATAAEERAREASISTARARAAQSFAEHQRVLSRIQASEPGSFQARALEALAPKYLAQSRAYLEEATRLQQDLGRWQDQAGRATQPSNAVLSLEVLKTRSNGGSLLLHYGNEAAPRLMLFDGGGLADYKQTLKPRLEGLRRQGQAEGPLPIDLVVSGQTDIEYLGGLIQFVRELAGAAQEKRYARIDALWSNAFVPGEAAGPDPPRRALKLQLVSNARQLGIPINKPFSKLITLPEAGSARVRWNENLSITVLGPSLQYLRAFAEEWLKDWRRRARSGQLDEAATELTPDAAQPDVPVAEPATVGPDASAAAFLDDLTLETFSDPTLELIPSPLEISRPELPKNRDQSWSNLGSIVLLVELGGRRLLLTADSRADVLIGALAQAGYTDATGNMSVDVMVVPHGGSQNNVSVEFFRRVKADHYVIQADGTHNNPRVATFRMLFDARRGDARPFTIYLNHAPEQYKKGYPVRDLCKLLRDERAAGTPYRIITPQDGQSSIAIQLLRPLPELNTGAENAACRGDK